LTRQHERIISLFWLFILFALFLCARLVKLQYIDHAFYRERADAQHLGHAELPAMRGEIRDRHNVVLAKSISRWSVAINPLVLKINPDVKSTTSALSRLLDLDEHWFHEVAETSGTFAWVSRKVTQEQAESVLALDTEGVFLALEPTPGKRYYPKGDLGSHLLGATGVDDQGLDGIESSFEKYLSGSPGMLKAFVDRDGWATLEDPAAMIRPARAGNNVVLTIDETIQYVAEKELAIQVEEYNATGGIVLVMDARSGEILAMAVNPTFPTKEFSSTPQASRRNRSITDPYEPGSTFKIFLAAAALESGVSQDGRFRSGGVLRVDGWSIHNANDGLHAGAMENLRDILAYSFNVGTASVALHIGKAAYYKSLVGFGFGSQTGVDLVGESEGILHDASEWADINTATISFGQGVACTPLQLVSALQGLVNGGIRMKPKLVRAIVDSDNNVVTRFEPQALGRVASAKVSRQMLEILENVCQNGTGKKANVKGYRVGGKTGTAQLVENGVYSPNKFIASFLGVAPVNDPRIVILVIIEKPSVQWGGVVAAPVFSRVAEKALWKLGVHPDSPCGDPPP
jgi:cell division protein FtsI/penicillin-binding protein 2